MVRGAGGDGIFEKQDKTQMAMLPAELRRSLLQSVTEGKTLHLTDQLGEVFKIFSAEVASSSWIDAFLANIKAELLREITARGETMRSGCRNGSRPAIRLLVCRCLSVR